MYLVAMLRSKEESFLLGLMVKSISKNYLLCKVLEEQSLGGHSEKEKRCLTKMLIGSYLVATGIGFIDDIYVNNFIDYFESKKSLVLGKTIIWAFLIVWILLGIWIFAYGYLNPCPEEEY